MLKITAQVLECPAIRGTRGENWWGNPGWLKREHLGMVLLNNIIQYWNLAETFYLGYQNMH